jgi:hypothetical protein
MHVICVYTYMYTHVYILYIQQVTFILFLLLLFMSMWWEYFSELRSPADLLFIHQVIHVSGESWWDDIDRVIPKNSEKNLAQCHFVHHRSHMEWPGCEPRPPLWEAVNYLKYGKTYPVFNWIPHQKDVWGMEIWLHIFLKTLAVDWGECSASSAN